MRFASPSSACSRSWARRPPSTKVTFGNTRYSFCQAALDAKRSRYRSTFSPTSAIGMEPRVPLQEPVGVPAVGFPVAEEGVCDERPPLRNAQRHLVSPVLRGELVASWAGLL